MAPIRDKDYSPPVKRITVYPKAPAAVRREASIAPNGQTTRATNQKIHSYTNAQNQYLQEKIPPTKPYIGLRRAYRPGYAICVIIAGVINLISGIIMTALAYSGRNDVERSAATVLKFLGPIVIVIGIIFLLCGPALLLHYRKTEREEKEARERGHGFYDRPSHKKRPRYRGETRQTNGQPVYSTDAASIPTQGPEYSLYDEFPRNSRRQTRRPPNEPVGGDWKYVSDIKDATLTPNRYPRELRRSERHPNDHGTHQHRMYPYDTNYKTADSHQDSSRPPRVKRSQTLQDLNQRY